MKEARTVSMRRFQLALGVLVAACGLVATLALPSPGAHAAEGSIPAPLALGGNDPVRLAEGETVLGSAQFEVVHEELRYRFASAATRDRFNQDPARWAIQNDSCPVAPGTPADPSIFAVHQKRIYTFASEECRTNFLADPESYVGGPGGNEKGEAGSAAHQQNDAAKPMAQTASRARRSVAILVYDGVELLDFAGPGEVFASAGRFDVFTVGPTGAPITSQGFVEVAPRYSVASAPRPDILIVPGGAAGNIVGDPAVMRWIKTVASGAEQVLSVCNGALILAHAGLLDGLEATTHHNSIAALRQHAPKTTVHDDRRFVDNGKVVTAAGVSAGIDMSLHVVAKLLGEPAAASAARYMEYGWRAD